jgi:thiamine biosynthesis protein ThiS
MYIKINGEDRQTESKNITELLAELSIMPARVAAEVNHRIIKKADYSTCQLQEGDSVEIVNFVGGG